MNGYDRIARGAAASGCHCWFSSQENELSLALQAASKDARRFQTETSDQAACMAIGAAAAGECPLLAVQHISPSWLLMLEQQQLSCVIVQILPAEEMQTQTESNTRLLLPTDGVEAARLIKEAFCIARNQKAPVLLRLSRALCETAEEPNAASDLYRQVEQVMSSVGARLDEAGRKLDEKLNSPEVLEKAEALKKQAEKVTAKAADSLSKGVAALADSISKLARSLDSKQDEDSTDQK